VTFTTWATGAISPKGKQSAMSSGVYHSATNPGASLSGCVQTRCDAEEKRNQ